MHHANTCKLDRCEYQLALANQIAFGRLLLRKRGLLQTEKDLDEFFRQAFLMLVTHEVGHFLGLPQNFKASRQSSYEELMAGETIPLSQARSWITSRFIFPENPRSQFCYMPQELGIWDELAIEYLYRDLSHFTPEEERRELEKIAAQAEFNSRTRLWCPPVRPESILRRAPMTLETMPLPSSMTGCRWHFERSFPIWSSLSPRKAMNSIILNKRLDAAVFGVCLDYYDILVRHIGGRRFGCSMSALPFGGRAHRSSRSPGLISSVHLRSWTHTSLTKTLFSSPRDSWLIWGSI